MGGEAMTPTEPGWYWATKGEWRSIWKVMEVSSINGGVTTSELFVFVDEGRARFPLSCFRKWSVRIEDPGPAKEPRTYECGCPIEVVITEKLFCSKHDAMMTPEAIMSELKPVS